MPWDVIAIPLPYLFRHVILARHSARQAARQCWLPLRSRLALLASSRSGTGVLPLERGLSCRPKTVAIQVGQQVAAEHGMRFTEYTP